MNCIILSHFEIYDILNISYFIYYLTKKYFIVYLFIKKENIYFYNTCFSHLKNIKYIYIDDIDDIIYTNNNVIIDNKDNINLYINNFIKNDKSNFVIIKLGIYNTNWVSLKNKYEIDNLPINYFEIFNEQINTYYKINSKLNIYNYNLSRNFDNENRFYTKLKEIYKTKYIFVYNLLHKDIIPNHNNKINIYNPYTDIYNNKDWEKLETTSIMDYLKIIENSEELHINDLNMIVLLSFIDLKHIKNKYFYSNKIFIKEYFKNLQDWNFIYK